MFRAERGVEVEVLLGDIVTLMKQGSKYQDIMVSVDLFFLHAQSTLDIKLIFPLRRVYPGGEDCHQRTKVP